MRKLSFEQAKARYVHRFTGEHVPAWALLRPCDSGGTETRYYAPQFATDREWYDATKFPGEEGHPFPDSRRGDCYTAGQTWPLGQWLDKPYRRAS